MRIASYSVLGRILAEVEGTPTPPLDGPERVEGPGEAFEIRRASPGSFATAFHFWAHALRDLLVRSDRPDLFEPIATQALCRSEDGRTVERAFHEHRGPMNADPAAPFDFRCGYEMVGQDVLASWIGERPEELVAFFWIRTDWLASAEPFDPRELDPDVE